MCQQWTINPLQGGGFVKSFVFILALNLLCTLFPIHRVIDSGDFMTDDREGKWSIYTYDLTTFGV